MAKYTAPTSYFASTDGEIPYTSLTPTLTHTAPTPKPTYFVVPLGEICVFSFSSVKRFHKTNPLCKMFQN